MCLQRGYTRFWELLSRAFILQVLVFNCDEEFDFRAMGRIFVGLVKCGAWGCFDEFNRLDEEVLSAVSQQIQIIQVGPGALGLKVEAAMVAWNQLTSGNIATGHADPSVHKWGLV